MFRAQKSFSCKEKGEVSENAETEIFYKFFKSLPTKLEGPDGRPPFWGGLPPIPENCPAGRMTAGSRGVPPQQRRYCKNRVFKNYYNNRILNLVSGFIYRNLNFGDSYLGHL